MNDHFRGVRNMINDTPRTDEAQFGTGRVSVSFARQLERQLNAANERIRLLIAERDTARRQADQNYKLREEFRELLGTDDVEQGVVVVREMKERIKRLEEELERTKQDRNAIAKKTREPLLLKLDHAADRIKRLEEAGDKMEAWLRDERLDAVQHTVSKWRKAKEVKL